MNKLANININLGDIDLPPTNFPSGPDSIMNLIANIIALLLQIGGGLAVIALIIGGVMYITAGGDPAQAEKARKTITWAVVGIVFAFLAIVIVNWVQAIIEGTFR